MPKLTDTQVILLSTAAARSDLALLPAPPSLTADDAAIARSLKSLLRRGLIAAAPTSPRATSGAGGTTEDAELAQDGKLTITLAGLAAIGIEEAADTADPATAEGATAETPLPVEAPAGPGGGQHHPEGADAPQGAEGTAEAGAAAAATGARQAGKPRRATKKERLIALLSAEPGIDVVTLSATLGWQTHTTRAALTGLRKAGYRVEGAKPPSGGAQLYRIVAMPTAASTA